MKTTTLLLAVVLLGVGANALAQEQMTGMFRMSMTTAEVLDSQTAEAIQDIIASDEAVSWQVYVPENYSPQRPSGLLIFLDPKGWGGIPDPWRAVMDSHNLIWIGAKKDEPRPSMEKKVWSSVLGLRAIEQQYALDLNRVYVASLEGEAFAALNTQLFANEIRGAIYMRGSVFWKSIEASRLEALTRKRHVFMTGTNDKNKQQVRSDADNYRREGIHNVKLIFATRRLGNPPNPEFLDEAIRYLDGYE